MPKKAGGRQLRRGSHKIVDNGDWEAYDVLTEDISLVNYRSQLNRVLAQVFV
jgi:ABC-type transporter MlaC component